MHKISLFFLVLLISGCDNGELQNTETFDELIEDQWNRNNSELKYIVNRVRDEGNRTKDLELLNSISDLIEFRNKLKIPNSIDSVDQLLTVDKVRSYSKALSEYDSSRTSSEYQLYRNRLNNLLANNNLVKTDVKQVVLLNLLIYESKLLRDVAQSVTGCIWNFGYRFVMNPMIDTIQVNQPHEIIINIDEVPNKTDTFNYQMIQIINSDRIIPSTIKAIGSSVYISFTPDSIGEYRIKGELKGQYKNIEPVQIDTFDFKLQAE